MIFCPVCRKMEETVRFFRGDPVLTCGHVKEVTNIDLVLSDILEERDEIREVLQKMLEDDKEEI